eukprot:gene14981-37388_t
MAPFIREEVNTFDAKLVLSLGDIPAWPEVKTTAEEGEWVVTTADPNVPAIGKRFKKDGKRFADAVRADPAGIAARMIAEGKVVVEGEELTDVEINLVRAPKGG